MLVSREACMNTDLFGCKGPAYFTVAPFLVLCARCVKARFGVDVDVPSSTRANDAWPAPVASSIDPINAPAGHETGHDGRPAGAQSSERVR